MEKAIAEHQAGAESPAKRKLVQNNFGININKKFAY